MVSRVNRTYKQKLINPPSWLPANTMFETMMGSIAYGCSTDHSDVDVYGFCMPPKDVVFPHLAGHIQGFGQQPEKFRVWQQHHVQDKEAKKEYDFAIYNIVDFFQLCMENNPNMINALFVPRRCVLHSTAMYEHIREHKEMFLHKGSWHKFRGYANSQMSKMDKEDSSNIKELLCFEQELGIKSYKFEDVVNERNNKSENPSSLGYYDENNIWVEMKYDSRETELSELSYEQLDEYFFRYNQLNKREKDRHFCKYDLKFAYHTVRLLLECEQIMATGTLRLDRDSNVYKAIRAGEWSLERLKLWVEEKERSMETLYAESKLPDRPNEKAIKTLLLECMEMHYGSLEKVVVEEDKHGRLVRELEELVRKHSQ